MTGENTTKNAEEHRKKGKPHKTRKSVKTPKRRNAGSNQKIQKTTLVIAPRAQSKLLSGLFLIRPNIFLLFF